MKFSELWLREWVNINSVNSIDLVEQITRLGLEVDNVEPVSEIFHGIVVGEILECENHPHSNRLKVTKVNVGSNQLLKIICDAPNCYNGLKVVVATIDSILAYNFKTKLKTYEEFSQGILCSFSQLGIFYENNDKIIELPRDAPVGKDIRSYLQLDDNILNINITSNRSDCLSIMGIARDIAALNNCALIVPEVQSVRNTITNSFAVRVEIPAICPCYLIRVINGIDMKVSTPLWISEKLRRCGITLSNTILDISNYVMLELGQPIQVFDVQGMNGEIVVRYSKLNEVFVMPDCNIIKLKNNSVVISNHDKILAIGGILCSKYSNINEKTKNILLQSAYFDPSIITDHTRSYGISTEISYRYERGVDPTIQYKAMERITKLILEICGGEVGPITDNTQNNFFPQRLSIDLYDKNIKRLIGYGIDSKEVTDILRRLGCKVTREPSKWKIIPPSWRFDLVIEEDLIEEIARIYGYDNIPSVPIKSNSSMKEHCESDLSLKQVKNLLINKGYQEVITYSFVNPTIQQLLHPEQEALILPNPISSDMSVMRLSLWTGLLCTTIYNNNRQQNRIRLFESGLRFVPTFKKNYFAQQDFMIAGILSGNLYEEHWNLEKRVVDFYDLKGDIESLLDLTGKLNEISFQAHSHPGLHPGQSAGIYLYDECIGFLGTIHPYVQKKLNISEQIFLFELLWNKINHRNIPIIRDISRFPANRRDISIVVDDNIPTGDIITQCKKVGANQLVDINLFDVYRGKGIKEGKKSLTISLILQDNKRTLEEEQVAAIVEKYVALLKERFQATLRD